ncbi:MAG TPA: right-handed parallel beta-helix repeat-containing protein [Gemmatimonadales bacterium]|nr:right-handed parallel beta-helix repeat-containing protein [Gemmatimonadales bacterium]
MPAPAHSAPVVVAPVTAGPDPSVKGRRYYVDSRGLDSATGDSTAPFRSIQQAAAVAGPGDTILVRPGIYTGADRVVSLTRSGRPGAWITFLSEHRWKAIVDGRDGQSMEAWYFGPGVGHIRVEGFEIRGFYEHAFDTYGGDVHDLIIARNRVHHIGRNCTDTSNGRTGASLGAGTRRVILDGNLWHDIGRLAPGEQGCSPKTRYYQNHDHGIYVADADDITIINNVFYAFSRGWAIHRYHSRGTSSRGLLIANNTFTGRNPYRPGQIILATPTSQLRIENNIFDAPQVAALYFESVRFSGGVVQHNMVHGGGIRVGRPRGIGFARNREHTDPRFTGGGDVRLGADSPAIDAGRSLPEVPHDAEGVRRPKGAGYDLGAYERQ